MTLIEKIVTIVFMGLFWLTLKHFMGFEWIVIVALATIFSEVIEKNEK